MNKARDIIEIKEDRIIAQLSYTVKKLDDSVYMGYIPSLDIPFTIRNREAAREIAGNLIISLFMKWLNQGKLDLFKEKLEKFKFTHHILSPNQFIHSAPSRSFKIHRELDVV